MKHWNPDEQCEGTFLSNASGQQKELGFVLMVPGFAPLSF
jgi:hypothetical protein